MQHKRILIVDDDTAIVNLLRYTIEEEGYQVFIAGDGVEAIRIFNEISPDLIILDLILPDGDGFEVCRVIREKSPVPILALSALKSEEDKVKSLDLGMNDYMIKPFGNKELLARIRALLRNNKSGPNSSLSFFDDGYLKIDYLAFRVITAGKEVTLTPIEFSLLRELTQNAGVILGYNELLTRVWGPEYKNSANLLFRHINSLHKKIEPEPDKPRYIINVKKSGYRYDRHQTA